jgi:multidrug resistance protein
MLSMAIFPLWWSAFSEAFGRRSIYLISFILFVLFGILSAVSNSIAMLVVMRMLSGGAAASVQAVGAGTIADVWMPKERGRAMGIFYLGPLCGPLFAPIIGGALAQRWNWRATLWFLVIYGGELWPKFLCDTDMTDPIGLKPIALSLLRPLMGIFRHNMAVHCLRSPGNLEGWEYLEREGCC